MVVRPQFNCPSRDASAPPTLAAMTVGIMGLGYVGLPLAVAFAEEGHDVVAVDVDPRKVEALARGESYIEDVSVRAARGGRRPHRRRRRAPRTLARCDAVLDLRARRR